MKLLCVYVQTDTSLEWMVSVSDFFFVSMGMHSEFFDSMLMYSEFFDRMITYSVLLSVWACILNV